MLRRIWRRIGRLFQPRPEALFALQRPITLPAGVTEADLRCWLATVHPAGAPPDEMARYCEEDFRRFLITSQLTQGLRGRCLELGANPYFTTMLLRRFSDLDLTLANYFGPQHATAVVEQEVVYEPWQEKQPGRVVLPTHHFNVEKDRFPFDDGTFDIVLFCEILEHLLEDPLFALREIHRVLKLGGSLVLTTPNVARLENIARLAAGENVYDPYSGYGPYGRHNREYTLAEVSRLLEHTGFTVENAFTSDVRDNRANLFFPSSRLVEVLRGRTDLGQYLFVRANKTGPPREQRPEWLFRSYDGERGASAPCCSEKT